MSHFGSKELELFEEEEEELEEEEEEEEELARADPRLDEVLVPAVLFLARSRKVTHAYKVEKTDEAPSNVVFIGCAWSTWNERECTYQKTETTCC